VEELIHKRRGAFITGLTRIFSFWERKDGQNGKKGRRVKTRRGKKGNSSLFLAKGGRDGLLAIGSTLFLYSKVGKKWGIGRVVKVFPRRPAT